MHRSENLGDGRVGGEHGSALAWPVELVALLWTVDDVIGELLAELIEVDRAHNVTVGVNGLCYGRREQRRDPIDVALGQVGRVHPQFVHDVLSSSVQGR